MKCSAEQTLIWPIVGLPHIFMGIAKAWINQIIKNFDRMYKVKKTSVWGYNGKDLAIVYDIIVQCKSFSNTPYKKKFY